MDAMASFAGFVWQCLTRAGNGPARELLTTAAQLPLCKQRSANDPKILTSS